MPGPVRTRAPPTCVRVAPAASATSTRQRPRPARAIRSTRPVDVLDPLVRAREHPGQVLAVVAVADRGRAGVDPARVAALADQVLLPGEGHRRRVDRLPRLAELAVALVREADVLDRGHRQRLLARGHAVAAEPGGGALGPLDDLQADRAEPELVERRGPWSRSPPPWRRRRRSAGRSRSPWLGDHQPAAVGAEGDRAFAHPLGAAVDRPQVDLGEDGAQHPLHLQFGVAGGEAAAGAAAEGDPGVGAGLACRGSARGGSSWPAGSTPRCGGSGGCRGRPWSRPAARGRRASSAPAAAAPRPAPAGAAAASP